MKESYVKNWLRDALGIFNLELRNILHDGGVMIIFVVAGFLYPILYNFVYKNGILEDTPIAVVDDAACSDTRRMIREMDATREIDIAYRCTDMNEAKTLLQQRKVNGIVYFPSDFGDRLAAKETATFSIYADMSSFLYYKNLLMGSEFVMLHEINSIKIERLSLDGLTDQEADATVNTVRYEDINPYNRAFSYSIFLISAILMLIIQQVMFYGMGMSVGTMREENRSFASLPDTYSGRGVGRVVLGRGGAYWLLFMAIGIYVCCIVPAMFGFPQRGSFWNILLLLALFVTVCVFFSMTWTTLVTRRESAFLLFLFMSPVLVFLTGLSWPNTAGAPLTVVAPQLRALCIQGAAYYILACVAVYVENFALKQGPKIKEKARVYRGLPTGRKVTGA